MTKEVRRNWAVGISVVVMLFAVTNSIWVAENPFAAKLADFGQWISGLAGALALIWLVIGYLQQGEELELQRQELAATREQLALQKIEMARLADEAARQAQSIEATEQHARRDTFMRLFEHGQSIQATLIRSLDASLFSSRAAIFSGKTGRDFYLTFAAFLDSEVFSLNKQFRHCLVKNGQLFVSTWINAGTTNAGWRSQSCEMDDLQQLLWFDEMLRKEAAKADPSDAMVKFVEALPTQRALSRLRLLRSELTDDPRPERP